MEEEGISGSGEEMWRHNIRVKALGINDNGIHNRCVFNINQLSNGVVSKERKRRKMVAAAYIFEA
jgi:hypothetical protein